MVTTRRSTRSYKKARIEEQDTSSFATQSINVSDDDFQEPIVSAVRQTRSSVKRRTRSSNVYINMDITPSSSRQESVVTESGDSDESSIAQSNTTLPTSVASSARDSESEMEKNQANQESENDDEYQLEDTQDPQTVVASDNINSSSSSSSDDDDISDLDDSESEEDQVTVVRRQRVAERRRQRKPAVSYIYIMCLFKN